MLIPKENTPDYSIWNGTTKPNWAIIQEVFNKSDSSYVVSFVPGDYSVYDRGGSLVIKLECDHFVTTDAMRALAGAILEYTGGKGGWQEPGGAEEVNRSPIPPKSGGNAS